MSGLLIVNAGLMAIRTTRLAITAFVRRSSIVTRSASCVTCAWRLSLTTTRAAAAT
jgi:hypothetical protein